MASHEPAPQSVTSAWVQYLRREVYRVRDKNLARIGCIGCWMATFANADGTSVTVSREHLAILAGVAPETVSRAIKVLSGVGMLRSRRRPNQSAEKILTLPLSPPDWEAWLPVFSETRQKRAYQAQKAREMEELLASREAPDSVHGRYPDSVRGCVPDSVRSGGSEPLEEAPDSVRRRPRIASTDAIRTASAAGGTMSYLPPVDTSTEDLDTPPLPPQQPVRAREAREEDQFKFNQRHIEAIRQGMRSDRDAG